MIVIHKIMKKTLGIDELYPIANKMREIWQNEKDVGVFIVVIDIYGQMALIHTEYKALNLLLDEKTKQEG